MLPQKNEAAAKPLSEQDWFNDLYEASKERKKQEKQIPLPPPDDECDNGYRCFSNHLFNALPGMLREPANRFTDLQERELFLVGALGVVSGMLPNYIGNYFGSSTGTNLYCFIAGNYGAGKGALKWARMLGEITHLNRLDEARVEDEQYRLDKVHYNKQLTLFNKGKLAEAPQEPRPPRHLKLFIPANTTKTAVMQLLEENDGNGIIFETEGDTLADMLRQDYGNFSDILRKAYHHEPLSFFRRANNEDVSVENPALSVVLSGTYDQLVKLIPSIDNGLYSRFMFYMLHGNEEFRNPFDRNDFTLALNMERYASKYAELYKVLKAVPAHKQFVMTEQQEALFNRHFKYVKDWTREHVSADLDGSVNRMAVMAYRIAMILTIVRHFEANPQLPAPALTCTDTDLQSALAIIDVLSYNAIDVYKYLEKHGIKRATNQKQEANDDERTLCCRYKQQGMSLRKIAAEVFGNVNAHTKVKRILKDYGLE